MEEEIAAYLLNERARIRSRLAMLRSGDMPAFKGKLPRKDIWALVAYVRAGLPRASP